MFIEVTNWLESQQCKEGGLEVQVVGGVSVPQYDVLLWNNEGEIVP